MRKISVNESFDENHPDLFYYHRIVVKENDQVEELKAPHFEEDYKNFTLKQLDVIRKVNYVLTENLQGEMTNEEAEYLIFPFGREQKVKPEDLQKLAGFEVHKEIVYK